MLYLPPVSVYFLDWRLMYKRQTDLMSFYVYDVIKIQGKYTLGEHNSPDIIKFVMVCEQ